MEVSGDILSTYLNKENLKNHQVFLLFQKILQEYFDIDFIERKLFESHRKNSTLIVENQNVVFLSKHVQKIEKSKNYTIFLPKKILLPDLLSIFEEIEKFFSKNPDKNDDAIKRLYSCLRAICDLSYQYHLFPEVTSDASNCVVQQLSESVRNKVLHAKSSKDEKIILEGILQEEKQEKGFDEVNFVGIYLERCIEEYILQISKIISLGSPSILLEIADKYVENGLFEDAKNLYEKLNFQDKKLAKNYFEYLEKTQNRRELDTFCINLLHLNPANPKAKAYLIIAAFHDYLENQQAISMLKKHYEDPNFHSLVIQRLIQIITTLKDSFIIGYDITSYVGAVYFIIGDEQKSRRYFKYNSSKNQYFGEILNHLNKE